MAFSLLPREDEYFALFTQLTGKIQEATNLLVRMVTDDGVDFISYSKQIKDVEHGCDEITHSVTTKLNKSFITPFDREDIYTLSVALDDVCDYIDAAARAVVMYNIHESDPFAVELAVVLQKQAAEIHGAVAHLKTAKGMEQNLLDIQRLENDADEVYFRAMAALFRNSDAVKIIKWKELYEILENGTDR